MRDCAAMIQSVELSPLGLINERTAATFKMVVRAITKKHTHCERTAQRVLRPFFIDHINATIDTNEFLRVQGWRAFWLFMAKPFTWRRVSIWFVSLLVIYYAAYVAGRSATNGVIAGVRVARVVGSAAFSRIAADVLTALVAVRRGLAQPSIPNPM
jgi:hypothetical protein